MVATACVRLMAERPPPFNREEPGVWVAMQDVDTPLGTFKKGRLVPDDDPVLSVAHDGWFRHITLEEQETLGLAEVPVLESLGEKRIGTVVVRVVR